MMAKERKKPSSALAGERKDPTKNKGLSTEFISLWKKEFFGSKQILRPSSLTSFSLFCLISKHHIPARWDITFKTVGLLKGIVA